MIHLMGHPQIRLVGNTSKKNRSSQEKSEFKQGGVAEGLYTQKEGELSVWAFLNNTGHHSYRGFLQIQLPEED